MSRCEKERRRDKDPATPHLQGPLPHQAPDPRMLPRLSNPTSYYPLHPDTLSCLHGDLATWYWGRRGGSLVLVYMEQLL
ncbi:hypothetical protein Pmani_010986 [Petrolisthes manimaculis]|uniref:Uncharacterized protein n=1 Tax=Petrolisthes manimaculis TaxID=1843537 RepID=A0AAE1UGP1_9EUCA|nr:hypothetical protein Pmani_010986 [Petrolisthes manimaculis]